MVQRKDTGRPEVVHGRRCKQSEIEHEVMVAEFEVLTGIRLERSKKSGRTEPDGTGKDGETDIAVEIDNSGKMSKRQWHGKLRRYEETTVILMVVATSEARMRKLMHWSEVVKDRAVFTTFERLAAGGTWLDQEGREEDLKEQAQTNAE